MSDGFIRNREGRIVGKMSHDYDKGGWLRDGQGNLVARVDADGWTRDRNGLIVGYGDHRLRELGMRERKRGQC